MKSFQGVLICCVVLITLIPSITLAQIHEGNSNVSVTPTVAAPGDTIDVSFDYTIWVGIDPGYSPWEILLDEGPDMYDDRGGILLASGSYDYDGLIDGFRLTFGVDAPGLVIPASLESGQYTVKIVTGLDGWTGPIAYSHVAITLEAGGNDSTAPVIVLDDPSRDELWPPDNRSIDVIFTGCVTDEGSGVAQVELILDDEYGILGDIIDITNQLDGKGCFEVTLSLIASRNGYDRDGRQYNVSVRAVDWAGNSAESESVTVLVPHDHGRQKAHVRCNNRNRNHVAAMKKRMSRVRNNRRTR